MELNLFNIKDKYAEENVKTTVTEKDANSNYILVRLDDPKIADGIFKKIKSVSFKLMSEKLVTVDIQVKKPSVIVIPTNVGDE